MVSSLDGFATRLESPPGSADPPGRRSSCTDAAGSWRIGHAFGVVLQTTTAGSGTVARKARCGWPAGASSSARARMPPAARSAGRAERTEGKLIRELLATRGAGGGHVPSLGAPPAEKHARSGTRTQAFQALCVVLPGRSADDCEVERRIGIAVACVAASSGSDEFPN